MLRRAVVEFFFLLILHEEEISKMGITNETKHVIEVNHVFIVCANSKSRTKNYGHENITTNVVETWGYAAADVVEWLFQSTHTQLFNNKKKRFTFHLYIALRRKKRTNEVYAH